MSLASWCRTVWRSLKPGAPLAALPAGTSSLQMQEDLRDCAKKNDVARATWLMRQHRVEPDAMQMTWYKDDPRKGVYQKVRENLTAYCTRFKKNDMLAALLDGGASPFGNNFVTIERQPSEAQKADDYAKGGLLAISMLSDNEKALDLLLAHMGDTPCSQKNDALELAIERGKTPYVEKLLAANAAPTEDLLEFAHRKDYHDIILALETALETQRPQGPGYEDKPGVRDISLALEIWAMPEQNRRRLFNHLAAEFPGEMERAISRLPDSAPLPVPQNPARRRNV